MRCLESSVIKGLAEFGVDAFTTENVGVWVKGDGKEEKKICSIGNVLMSCFVLLELPFGKIVVLVYAL